MKDKNKDMIKALGTGIVLGGAIVGGGVYASTVGASNVSYSNASSGITSTNVQGSIDELYKQVKEMESLESIPSVSKFSAGSNIFFMDSTKACASTSGAPDTYSDTISGSVKCKGIKGSNNQLYIQFDDGNKIPVTSSSDITSSSNTSIRDGIDFSLNFTCAISRKNSVGSGAKAYVVVPKESCGIYKHLSEDTKIYTGYHMCG